MYLISHYDEYGSEDLEIFDAQRPMASLQAYFDKHFPKAEMEYNPIDIEDRLKEARESPGRPINIDDGWGGCQFHYIDIVWVFGQGFAPVAGIRNPQ